MSDNIDESRHWPRWGPLIVMLSVGLALYAFYLYSQTRPPIDFGVFLSPPLYGFWEPTLDRLALWVVPAAGVLAMVAWWFISHERAPTWMGIALLVVSGVATAAAIALVRGDTTQLVPPVVHWMSDLQFVEQLGLREFVERHPEMTADIDFNIYASMTHPPGLHLSLHGLFQLFGETNLLAISTAIAVLTLSAAAPAWLIGKVVAAERAGRIAAALFVAAPGPLLLAYSGIETMDGVFALFLSAAAALFMLGISRQSVGFSAVAGAVLAVGALMTYAAIFVAVAAGVSLLLVARSLKSAAAQLGAAFAGGLAILVIAYLTLGLDLLASYQAAHDATRPYDSYWIFASPAALLIWAGLPVAALGLMGTFRSASRPRQVLPLILIVVMLAWVALPSSVTRLRPGEVERTWAFLYPVLAGVAGPVVDRWAARLRVRPGVMVAGLLVISVGQAVLLQALWSTVTS